MQHLNAGYDRGRELSVLLHSAMSGLLVIVLAGCDAPRVPLEATVTGSTGVGGLDVQGLDFGQAYACDRFELPVKLVKVSSGTINCNLSTSCGCVRVEPDHLTLDPADGAEVRLSLDLIPDDSVSALQPHWDFNALLFVYVSSDTTATPIKTEWRVSGRAGASKSGSVKYGQ